MGKKSNRRDNCRTDIEQISISVYPRWIFWRESMRKILSKSVLFLWFLSSQQIRQYCYFLFFALSHRCHARKSSGHPCCLWERALCKVVLEQLSKSRPFISKGVTLHGWFPKLLKSMKVLQTHLEAQHEQLPLTHSPEMEIHLVFYSSLEKGELSTRTC